MFVLSKSVVFSISNFVLLLFFFINNFFRLTLGEIIFASIILKLSDLLEKKVVVFFSLFFFIETFVSDVLFSSKILKFNPHSFGILFSRVYRINSYVRSIQIRKIRN